MKFEPTIQRPLFRHNAPRFVFLRLAGLFTALIVFGASALGAGMATDPDKAIVWGVFAVLALSWGMFEASKIDKFERDQASGTWL